MIPFVGFAPDLPPETPGIFTDCTNIIPSNGMFISAPSEVDTGLGAITSACLGFAVTKKLDNTVRIFAGDSAKLYERSSSTWADKSKALGYSLGVDERWRFAQFGNISLATAKTATVQFIDAGSTFADAGTAPKASIIETINNQVFLFNINGMGFGDDVTRWACSAIGSYTDWTPAVSTQCASGQLLDSPGPITAGKKLGDIIVAYKESAMYVGQYVGAPLIWDFRRVPGDIGTPVQEAVVSSGTAHFFVGPDDFYVFDGSRPTALNSPVRNWFFKNVNKSYLYKTCGTFDRVNQRAYWWFVSSGSSAGVLDKCIVYNVKTNQWGKIHKTIEYVADYITAGLTYEGLGTAYSTYDSLPTYISYDSPFWNSGGSVVAYFGTDHKTYQLSGISGESSIITGHYGDNINYSTLSKIRPRFIVTPSASHCDYSYSNTDASTFSNKRTSSYFENWYNLLWSARWHKMEFTYTGNMSISGFDLSITVDGDE